MSKKSGVALEQLKLRRVSRLLYYYALSTKQGVVSLSANQISKVALLSVDESTNNMHRIGAHMKDGCKCRISRGKLEITFDVGAPNQVRHIFDYWVKVHEKRKSTKLTSDRRRKVQARLNERYTARDIKLGIDGILCSRFHVDGGYTDLTNICMSGSKLERFMELGKKQRIVRRKGILGHMSKVTS